MVKGVAARSDREAGVTYARGAEPRIRDKTLKLRSAMGASRTRTVGFFARDAFFNVRFAGGI